MSELYKRGYKNEINYSRGNRPLNWSPHRKRQPLKNEPPEYPEVIANCIECNDAWYAGTKQTFKELKQHGWLVVCNDCGTENYHEPTRQERKNLRYPHYNGCLGTMVKSKEHEADVARAMGMTLTEDQYY